jgi:hypothetical protein
MPRPSYFRSLTRGPERSIPHLRPARPPLWGPSKVADYDAADQSIVPSLDVKADSDRDGSQASLPAEPSQPSQAEWESSISILGSAQPFNKSERVTEFSTLPVAQPTRVTRGQRPAKLERQDQPSPASVEVASVSAETGRDKILPQKNPETLFSKVTERKQERASSPDRASGANRVQPVVQSHVMRPVTDARLSQVPSSQKSEALSKPEAHVVDAESERPAPEGKVSRSEALGVRLEVYKRSDLTRDRQGSVHRDPNYRLPVIKRALEPARLGDAPPEGNKVHIGSVDIHITPPATPPPQPAARQSPSVNRTVISRGFTSSFGLRQA